MPTIRSVTDIKSKLLRPALTSFYEVDIDLPKGDGVLASRLSALRADGSEDQDVLNLRCSEASLPGSNLATLETTKCMVLYIQLLTDTDTVLTQEREKTCERPSKGMTKSNSYT